MRRLSALLAAAAATPWPRDASQVVHDRYDIILTGVAGYIFLDDPHSFRAIVFALANFGLPL